MPGSQDGRHCRTSTLPDALFCMRQTKEIMFILNRCFFVTLLSVANLPGICNSLYIINSALCMKSFRQYVTSSMLQADDGIDQLLEAFKQA